MDKFQVIIRSAKERTADLSKKLAEKCFVGSNVTLINEYPLSKAHRTFLEMGADSKGEWVVAIDADVLVYKKGIDQLISQLGKYSENVFEIQGQILDKFFGGLRGGGVKFYRTKYIKQALEIYPTEEVIRPEGYLIAEMNKRGILLKQLKMPTGIHDFGQYYKDIFRKFVVHSKKHGNYIPILEPYWKLMSSTDLDFLIALEGLKQGAYLEGVTVDARNFSQDISEIMSDKNFKEKSEITNDINLNDISKFVENYISPSEYFDYLAEAANHATYIPRGKMLLLMKLKNSLKAKFTSQNILEI